MKIGFIGVGIMGKSMIKNLIKAGHHVVIYTRTKSKAQDLIDSGVEWRNCVKDCVSDREMVITIVGYPQDVEEVYFGLNGIIENTPTGGIILDMTTSQPELAIKIYNSAKEKGLKALDAPVTGGDVGAKDGTLSILVGGDKEVFDLCQPTLEAMGSKITYCGQAGNGQHTKMCNQIAIAGAISGVCEALTYAQNNNIDWATLFDAISTGAAGSMQMSYAVPRIIDNNFEPGFFIKHFIKDLQIAYDQSKKDKAPLSILETTLSAYKQLETLGLGDLGTQGLIKYYENFNN